MAGNDTITKSNGRPIIDLTGQKFGRLIVIKEGATKGRRRTWTCQCACGTIRDINQNSLRQGRSKSCGICESRQIFDQ